MATAVDAEHPVEPLTEEEIAFNMEVETLAERLRGLESLLEKSLKPRTFPDSMTNSKAVYGEHSANRSDVNKFIRQVGDLPDIVLKLKFENDNKEKKAGGYSLPVFINPVFAPMFGLQEGTSLWPQGQYPVISMGMMTAWTGHHHDLNNCNINGKGDQFRCSDYVKRFIGQYHNADAGKDTKGNQLPPFNLDCMNYPSLLKIYSDFILRANGKSVVPNLDENTLDGKNRLDAFKQLSTLYDQLKELKEARKKAHEGVEKCQKDLASAQLNVQNGIFDQSFYQTYQQRLMDAQRNYEMCSHNYRQFASQMGIPVTVAK